MATPEQPESIETDDGYPRSRSDPMTSGRLFRLELLSMVIITGIVISCLVILGVRGRYADRVTARVDEINGRLQQLDAQNEKARADRQYLRGVLERLERQKP
jgi:cell division protein FtsB